jgi:outer membrane cobalamin receptor
MDRNSSIVDNEPQQQAFYRSYLRVVYSRSIDSWYLGFSKEYILEYEESGTHYSIDPTKLSLAYLFKDFSVYMDYATRTISFPSMTDRYGWGKAWLPNPEIRPERGTNLDVGVRWSYQLGRLQLTRFSSRLKDKITFGVHPSCAPEDLWGCNYSENSTRGRNRGAELTWMHNWHATLATNVSWLILNSEERAKQFDPFQPALRRPDSKLTVQLSWQRDPWHFEAIAVIVSDAIDFGSRSLPAYQTYDLLVSREISKRMTWSFSGFNLTNEQYEQAFGYRTPPRQLNIGMQLTW